MRRRIHVLTLAVDDLGRAPELYRDGLGLESPGVIGTEFAGDATTPAGAAAMFQLQAGSSSPSTRARSWPRRRRSHWDRRSPASSASATRSPARKRSTQPGRAEAAGATLTGQAHDRPWGISSGYFRDPDGHLWKTIWNPELNLEGD